MRSCFITSLFLGECHMFSWIMMLKHVLSKFTCMEWFMGVHGGVPFI